jgi:UDP-3-O-[3-hydroxymyristoyl] glucosamine N-acyltransferase
VLYQKPVSDLAKELKLELKGNKDLSLSGVASLDEAVEGNLAFIRSNKYMKYIDVTKASAIIVPFDVETPDNGKAYLVSDNPYISFASVLESYYCPETEAKGVSEQAFLAEDVVVGKNTSIDAFVAVAEGSSIGDKCRIQSGVRIGRNVKIGKNVQLFANVVIEDNCVIGDHVILNPGVIVGSDGFGYTQTEEGSHKLPQIGNVIIEDHVEVGANTTIDRASMGSTMIGEGTKIDNLVQIGHGVKLGKHNVICSQVGIAGSVKTGDHVILASKAGVGDHLSIGTKTTVGPMAGVTKDLPENGLYSGFPAMPHQDWLKMAGTLAQLPSIREKLRAFIKF